jgi:hypothetical protein
MSGESFSLNPIGLEIIQLIKDVQSFDEVSRVILAKYAVDAETFDRYFYDFISTLKQFNLLEPEENG